MSRPVAALALIALFAGGFGLARAADRPDNEPAQPASFETVAVERAEVVRTRHAGTIPPYPRPRKPSTEGDAVGLSIVTPATSAPSTASPQVESPPPSSGTRPHGITVTR